MPEVACPNCGVVLEKRPTRSRKCADCGEKIVARTDRGTKERLLLTEVQADQFDARRAKEVARNKAIRNTESLGLTEEDFRHAEAALTREWGFDPGPGDVFWRLANQETQAAMVAADWHGLSTIYSVMGSHLKDEGRDHTRVQHQANDAMVRRYQAVHVERAGQNLAWDSEYGIGLSDNPYLGVRVIANACCKVCKALDRNVFSFEEALETSPLPPEGCTRDWCNCSWNSNIAIDD